MVIDIKSLNKNPVGFFEAPEELQIQRAPRASHLGLNLAGTLNTLTWSSGFLLRDFI